MRELYAISAAPAMLLLVLCVTRATQGAKGHATAWNLLALGFLNLLSLGLAVWGYHGLGSGRSGAQSEHALLVAYGVVTLWLVPFFWSIDTYLPSNRGHPNRWRDEHVRLEARLPKMRRVFRFTLKGLAVLWVVHLARVWFLLRA